jgi:hypothetical protein
LSGIRNSPQESAVHAFDAIGAPHVRLHCPALVPAEVHKSNQIKCTHTTITARITSLAIFIVVHPLCGQSRKEKKDLSLTLFTTERLMLVRRVVNYLSHSLRFGYQEISLVQAMLPWRIAAQPNLAPCDHQ